MQENDPKRVHIFGIICCIIHCNATILIITIYRPPKSKHGFFDEFSELLSKVSTDYDCLIISGDFNIHVDKQTDPEAFCLTQHASGPTFNQGHTLDLIISNGCNIAVPSVMDVAISDYCCIFFVVLCFCFSCTTDEHLNNQKRIINNNTIET